MEPGTGDPADTTIRRCQRILSMVGELHKVGYQKLRISPGMSPSGMHWRCVVTSADNILQSHGALVARFDEEFGAIYSSAQENEYFGWTDMRSATARDLARHFIRRFPSIVARSMGEDWPYAGWYVQMLGVAEAGHLPIAYEDWGDPTTATVLRTISASDVPTSPALALPPPGLAAFCED